MITIIGDVHGKTHIYQKRLRQHFQNRRTIQIGDMGMLTCSFKSQTSKVKYSGQNSLALVN